MPVLTVNLGTWNPQVRSWKFSWCPRVPCQVWHMSLDNTRNRTLQLNLAISVASFALMASTVPASFLGMNLHSGMEVQFAVLPVAAASFPKFLLTMR